MKKIFRFLVISFTLIVLISASAAGVFVYSSLKDLPPLEFKPLKNKLRSIIYDESGNEIEVFGETKNEYVSYNDIPPILVNALISIEDINFFSHKGVDYARTFKAFIHNLTSSYKQGGSTITQQLIKNTLLTNEQTYKRKVQEAYLALKIEQKLTKEDILTLYFNSIYFDQSIPGVKYASKRYFGKDLSLITLPEAAILAGVVKSASYYNPFKYPQRINERKNLVLSKMKEYAFISEKEYDAAYKTKVEDIVIEQGSNYIEPTYRFQSYLDIVYLQIEDLIKEDPYLTPLEIHTYLDSSLQTHLDSIQKGDIIEFKDKDQQIGGSIIRNEDGAIVGVLGGRNYNGSRIFNRAYSLVRQPASTIKPIFSYLLAAEHLHYNQATNVLDAPYTYKGTSITVQNADKNYLGYIPVVEALGYSKNTAALYTLEKVINKIGQEEAINHLKRIGIMDEGPFALPYGIGGMTYGVSPTKLAGAYSILNREGKYIEPSTISLIKNRETGEVLYKRELNYDQVVSKESAFQIASTLIDVVKNNYYRIGSISVKGVDIGAKTGTNGYDENAAHKLGYPTSADKDSWLCGFSSDYTMAVWTGFDVALKGEKHYFGKGDERRQIPKLIFHNVMSKIASNKNKLLVPNTLTKINVVKGTENYYLPNEYIPSSYITSGYFYNNEIPTTVLPLPSFPSIINAKGFIFDDEIEIAIEVNKKDEEIFDYTKIYGDYGFLITYVIEGEKYNIFTKQNKIALPYNSEMSEIAFTPCFENNFNLTGTPYFFVL